MLRAVGETGITQENIQDWLQLDKGDPGFQLLVFLYFLNGSSTLIIFAYFHQHYLCHYFHLFIF
jgi:hypothetical protein